MLLNPVDEIDQLVICLKKKSDRRNNKTHIVNGSRRLAVSFGKQNGWSKEVNGSRTSTLTHGYTAVGSREEYQTLSLSSLYTTTWWSQNAQRIQANHSDRMCDVCSSRSVNHAPTPRGNF